MAEDLGTTGDGYMEPVTAMRPTIRNGTAGLPDADSPPGPILLVMRVEAVSAQVVI